MGRGATLTYLIKSCANLSCSWIHFSSSPRKTLTEDGEEKKATFFRTVLLLNEEINDRRLPPDSTPKVRCGRLEAPQVPGHPDPQGNAALTPYANHKSGEYFGLFDICGKGASFMGTSLVSGIAQLTGKMNYGVAVISGLFVIGYYIFKKAVSLEEV